MNQDTEKNNTNDIEKIKEYILGLGFICNSTPNAQNLIYSKKGDLVIIKNKEKKVE